VRLIVTGANGFIGRTLVEALLAVSEHLTLQQEKIELRGVALEARIIAEDPAMSFMPTSGQITYINEPSGSGIRVDSALYEGMQVSTDYDSLLAKLIVWGEDRATAIRRMIGAIDDFQIVGVTTDLGYLREVVKSESFLSSQVDTMFLESFQTEEPVDIESLEKETAIAAALFFHNMKKKVINTAEAAANQWQNIGWREQMTGNF
jgi:acetyl/propionyl-CoA carboxylase alpha subunit